MSMHAQDYKNAAKDSAAKVVALAQEYPKVSFLILGIVFGSITVLLLA